VYTYRYQHTAVGSEQWGRREERGERLTEHQDAVARLGQHVCKKRLLF
jgi:hypothetical protein